MSDYSDIIGAERPEPRHHIRMPRGDRAAQFKPFAALTGYDDAIDTAGEAATEEALHENDGDRLYDDP